VAKVAEVEIKSNRTLAALNPGDCFVTAYDYKREGRKAKVWMKIQTRHFNPNDEKSPKIGWMTIDLATGINGGHTLDAPVHRIKVEILPALCLG